MRSLTSWQESPRRRIHRPPPGRLNTLCLSVCLSVCPVSNITTRRDASPQNTNISCIAARRYHRRCLNGWPSGVLAADDLLLPRLEVGNHPPLVLKVAGDLRVAMRADVVHQFGPAAGLAVVDVCGKGRKQGIREREETRRQSRPRARTAILASFGESTTGVLPCANYARDALCLSLGPLPFCLIRFLRCVVCFLGTASSMDGKSSRSCSRRPPRSDRGSAKGERAAALPEAAM